MTRAPLRRVASAQNDGPSSPCSCSMLSPTSSLVCTTCSSGAFTNTPHSSTLRRSTAAMRCASDSEQLRGLPSKKIIPIAHAPSSSASSASSRLVIPQILTFGTEVDGHARVHTGGGIGVAGRLLGDRGLGGGGAGSAPCPNGSGRWTYPSGVFAFGTEFGRLPSVTVTVLCT